MKTTTSQTQAIWRQIFVLLPVHLNTIMMGCTIGWASNAIYFMNKENEISATLAESSLIISSADIGRLLLTLPAGILVDKFGRKKIVIATAILHFTGWLTLSLSSHLTTMCMARFALGAAYAFANATATISIDELAAPEIREKLTAIYIKCAWLGYLFQIVVSLLYQSYFTLSYCTLGICAFSVVFLYWALETPSYLISVSQDENAMKNLRYIRAGYSENQIQSEFNKIKKFIESEKELKLNTAWLQFVRSKEIRTLLIVLFFINFFASASGIHLLISYVTVIVPDNEFIPKLYYPSMVFSVCMIISFVLPVYIEKLPRRTKFMSGALGLSLIFLLLAVTNFYYLEYNNEMCKWVFTFGDILAIIVIAGSTLPMMNVLNSEMLPEAVKELGGSLCTIAQSLANLITVLVFNLVLNNFGLYYNFLIYSSTSLILLNLIYFLMPESRGKFLFEMQWKSNEKKLKPNVESC